MGSESSGDYDVWMRLVVRYMGRYIPGNPSFLVQNMPGAGSVTALRYLDANAPKGGFGLVLSGNW